jgi:hypothetical protein
MNGNFIKTKKYNFKVDEYLINYKYKEKETEK